MSRPAEHPSGPKQTTCLSLSPDHRQRLDNLAERLELSRSAVVEKLIDRATTTKATP